MQIAEHPTTWARQMSGRDDEGRPILAVLAKRSYQVTSRGQCEVATMQVPLVTEPQLDPENGDLLRHDSDLFPYKPACDIIIKGSAYAPGSMTTFEAAVRVGAIAKRLLVVGKRSCSLSHDDRLLFSAPEVVSSVPLRYDHAYGGRDSCAEAKYGNPIAAMQPYVENDLDLGLASPYRYPRNPCGTGFLTELSRDGIEQLRLPQLEDPLDPLTPERVAVGVNLSWLAMPLPQATDFVNYTWFPRMAYCGFLPAAEPYGARIAEVERGFTPENILEEEKVDLRLTNGASLGLQLAHLHGGEAIELVNMHPRQPIWRLSLPKERPALMTDGRKGRLNKTQSLIYSIVIEPDEERISVVWCGAARALRDYLPEELETMPFSARF